MLVDQEIPQKECYLKWECEDMSIMQGTQFRLEITRWHDNMTWSRRFHFQLICLGKTSVLKGKLGGRQGQEQGNYLTTPFNACQFVKGHNAAHFQVFRKITVIHWYRYTYQFRTAFIQSYQRLFSLTAKIVYLPCQVL